MSRATELIIAFLLIAILVSDRLYERELSSYAAHGQRQSHKESENSTQESKSPLLLVIADVEKTLEVHEKTLIVLSTIAIALFTGTLWRATTGLQDLAAKQSTDMKQSLAIAEKSADAAVKTAMPVLYPYVTNMEGLHPLHAPAMDDVPEDREIEHDANIFVAFDNYGKTPAIIRRVRAKLFLTVADQLPAVNIDTLPLHSYPVWVPGEARGKDLITGALDLKQRMTYTVRELRQLLAEARGNQFRRIALIGQVIYDDLFGTRHFCDFCVKVRLWETRPLVGPREIRAFQIAQGGPRYNTVSGYEIPDPDPLTE